MFQKLLSNKTIEENLNWSITLRNTIPPHYW